MIEASANNSPALVTCETIASESKPLRYITAAKIMPAKTPANQFGSRMPNAMEEPTKESQVNRSKGTSSKFGRHQLASEISAERQLLSYWYGERSTRET